MRTNKYPNKSSRMAESYQENLQSKILKNVKILIEKINTGNQSKRSDPD